jgi:hypothetical protein
MTTEQTLLSDTQFGAILAVLGGIGTLLVGTLRWGIGRIVKAIDDSSAERARHTETLVKVETKIDHAVDRLDDVHDLLVNVPPRARPSTPAMGSSGRVRLPTDDPHPQRGIATGHLLVILAGAGLVLSFLVALACHNDPIGPIPIDAACPLPALTHPCAALPCLSIEDCTIATPESPPRCKCPLGVGTPPYVAECYGL